MLVVIIQTQPVQKVSVQQQTNQEFSAELNELKRQEPDAQRHMLTLDTLKMSDVYQ